MAARFHSAEKERQPNAINAGALNAGVLGYLIALIASYPAILLFYCLFFSFPHLYFSVLHSFSQSAALCQQLPD